MLLGRHRRILALRSARKKGVLAGVDWQKCYEGVKEFLENE